jgi:hypothetical protein
MVSSIIHQSINSPSDEYYSTYSQYIQSVHTIHTYNSTKYLNSHSIHKKTNIHPYSISVIHYSSPSSSPSNPIQHLSSSPRKPPSQSVHPALPITPKRQWTSPSLSSFAASSHLIILFASARAHPKTHLALEQKGPRCQDQGCSCSACSLLAQMIG